MTQPTERLKMYDLLTLQFEAAFWKYCVWKMTKGSGQLLCKQIAFKIEKLLHIMLAVFAQDFVKWLLILASLQCLQASLIISIISLFCIILTFTFYWVLYYTSKSQALMQQKSSNSRDTTNQTADVWWNTK